MLENPQVGQYVIRIKPNNEFTPGKPYVIEPYDNFRLARLVVNSDIGDKWVIREPFLAHYQLVDPAHVTNDSFRTALNTKEEAW
jgi:hypothetical protein